MAVYGSWGKAARPKGEGRGAPQALGATRGPGLAGMVEGWRDFENALADLRLASEVDSSGA